MHNHSAEMVSALVPWPPPPGARLAPRPCAVAATRPAPCGGRAIVQEIAVTVARFPHAPLAAMAAAALLAACNPTPPAGPSPRPEPEPEGPPAPVAYVPLTAGLPPIPSVEGPLAIRLVAPEPGQAKPSRDSTFLYGSVGTGGAALTINGAQVPVAPNGAFLAYLRVPADGVWR